MMLRHKIIFLAVAPLSLALAAITVVVRQQAAELGLQQRASIEAAYVASKQAELKHYVELALHAIRHLYDTGRSDAAIKNEAQQILADLEFSGDGYFFIYDRNGRNIMHPRQPELVGSEMWDWHDSNGTLTVQLLINRANQGGGFVRYNWQKPSSQTVAPKMGYVDSLPRWGWVVGSGLYLDDIETALAEIDQQVSGHLRHTMLLIAAIAVLSALMVAFAGLLLNFSEQRAADAKLRHLAQRVVRSQEEERARLSRDLHDGISQWLVSIKLQIEAALIRIKGSPEQAVAARATFHKTATQINDVLAEVRRISHALRPAILDDLGLAAAVEHLCCEWRAAAGESNGAELVFESEGELASLTDVTNTVLFRVAQEALTNVARHAQARRVTVRLLGAKTFVMLQVEDDGKGFDLAQVSEHPRRGIGLSNMQERVEAVGGHLSLDSSAAGTKLVAVIPHRPCAAPSHD
ncbi:cache domain-containing protein [Herbaspirillum sp. YR522]|uniref:cache domain-containing protein n=1 Tax=Herbaspirillum sp. YR522 TaxID=1144342 RepID=UPI00026F538A|nr:cache domain-containing protein [Herbaspirillum sp. YR522]EJN07419.1 signal transduction histidine kinase [Herbaspirillum sp. YR522]